MKDGTIKTTVLRVTTHEKHLEFNEFIQSLLNLKVIVQDFSRDFTTAKKQLTTSPNGFKY